MNTKRSLELKHLNCCSVELRTRKLVHIPSQISDLLEAKQEHKKGGKSQPRGPENEGNKFKMSPYLQSCDVFLIHFFLVWNSGRETLVKECSVGNGIAADTSTQTLD